jgi:hypothetical protein
MTSTPNWQIIKDYPNYSVNNLGEIMVNKTNKIMKQYIDKYGYLRIILCGEKRKTFLVHRLVAMCHLEDFSNDLQVDHIDRNRQNNHVNNLRMATGSQNCHNTIKRKNTTSKYKCVHFVKKRNMWQSQVKMNGKLKWLGYYETEEEARNKYIKFMEDNNLINEFTNL